jgi:uncharacterized protein (TIGR03435 family)
MTSTKHAIVFALSLCVALGQAPAKVPTFDVASVKPDTVGTNEGPGRRNEIVEPTPLGLKMRNIRLRSAMKWAYQVQTGRILGPGWLDSERYLIMAKTGTPEPERQLRLMLQHLLADRFQIKSHRETRDMTVSLITVDKGGPKFKPSGEAGEGGVHYEIVNKVVANRATLSQFANSLTNAPRSVVPNETGLEGRYDFTLDLGVYEPIPLEDFPAVTARGLREQLGLRVESRRSQIPVLVVDHAEKTPIPN